MKDNPVKGLEPLKSLPDKGKWQVREMMVSDYEGVAKVWAEAEHLYLNECDTREGIAMYLIRNRGLCFVAEKDSTIVGTVLCGHDGRRGFLRHLAVAKGYRNQGIARDLIEKVLCGLSLQGIGKCNVFVLDSNVPGHAFWAHAGWNRLEDIYRTLQTETKVAKDRLSSALCGQYHNMTMESAS